MSRLYWWRFSCAAVLFVAAGCSGGGGDAGSTASVIATLQALMDGSQETTVTDPDALAAGIVELFDDGTVRFVIGVEDEWADDVIMMHIHRGAAGVDGGIEVDLLSGGATFDPQTNIATDTIQSTVTLVNEIAADPDQFYVNVHTNAAATGFVRGQLGPFTPPEWHARLDGENETTVVDADAQGAASFRATAPDEIRYVIALIDPAITDVQMAHIHVGPAGQDGAIVVDLQPGSATADVVNGTLSGTATVTLETLVRMLVDPAGFYCNVHTAAAPLGIARGQLETGAVMLWAALKGNEETTIIDPDARGGLSLFLETSTSGRAHLAVPNDTQDILDLTMAHVHAGEAGVDGAIVIDLQGGADYDGDNTTGSAEGSLAYTQEVFARILADHTRFYSNFHTAAAPLGLVRGQLTNEAQTFFAALDGDNIVPTVIDGDAAGAYVGLFTSPLAVSSSINMTSPPADDVVEAHIHDGPLGVNGVILIDLLASGSTTSGSTITSEADVAGRTFARLLAAPELFYVDVTTSGAPDGIARGQLQHAPGGLPPAGVSYTSPVIYETGSAITANVPMIVPGGGGITDWSIAPPLPAGLTIHPLTGVVSGTPTATQPSTVHTVTASNDVGSTTAEIDITVNVGPPTNLSYSTNPASYVAGSPITPNTPSSQGGAIAGYAVQSGTLPAGLSLNATTGVITGTPTTPAAATNVTIRGSNAAGFVDVVLSITIVAALQPPNISYNTPNSFTQNTAITPLTPTNTGGAVASYAVIGASLPAGLSLNTTTGAISGTPTTVTSAANYTIRATNAAGQDDFVISIEVTLAAPSNLSYSPATGIGYVNPNSFTTMTPTVTGTVTSWSISPSLPTGLSINASTGVISGSPSQTNHTGNTSFTVTATNSAGSTTVNITVVVYP